MGLEAPSLSLLNGITRPRQGPSSLPSFTGITRPRQGLPTPVFGPGPPKPGKDVQSRASFSRLFPGFRGVFTETALGAGSRDPTLSNPRQK